MNSILQSIKKFCGIPEEVQSFDPDILVHINTVMSVLTQLGVGPTEGFYVDEDTTWPDYFGDDSDAALIQSVKSYVYLRVRLLFDPPTNSGAVDAMERQMRELEWRITFTKDP